MTMKVIVINDDTDASRALVVETKEINVETKAETGGDLSPAVSIEAGKHAEFYVHSTAMLKVSEVEK